MRLLVLGANGKTGLHIVEQALSRSFTVRAFVHSNNDYPIKHDNLEVFQGDATNPALINKALEGVDAVASSLGQWGKGAPKDLQTAAMLNIIKGNENNKLKMVSLTGSGVYVKGDNVGVINRILNAGLVLVEPSVLQDGAQHLAALKASGLTYCVPRTSRLTNRPGKRQYKTGRVGDGKTSFYIARADMAKFMLDAIATDKFNDSAPVVGY